MVILITGKAGAGKTHYAAQFANELKNSNGQHIAHIDGDIFRQQMGNQEYTDKGRYKNLMQAARKAAEYEKKGFLVICSFIAPKRIWRDAMRAYWEESMIVYIPGGTLWEGTNYEKPSLDELQIRKIA